MIFWQHAPETGLTYNEIEAPAPVKKPTSPWLRDTVPIIMGHPVGKIKCLMLFHMYVKTFSRMMNKGPNRSGSC